MHAQFHLMLRLKLLHEFITELSAFFHTSSWAHAAANACSGLQTCHEQGFCDVCCKLGRIQGLLWWRIFNHRCGGIYFSKFTNNFSFIRRITAPWPWFLGSPPFGIVGQDPPRFAHCHCLIREPWWRTPLLTTPKRKSSSPSIVHAHSLESGIKRTSTTRKGTQWTGYLRDKDTLSHLYTFPSFFCFRIVSSNCVSGIDILQETKFVKDDISCSNIVSFPKDLLSRKVFASAKQHRLIYG